MRPEPIQADVALAPVEVRAFWRRLATTFTKDGFIYRWYELHRFGYGIPRPRRHRATYYPVDTRNM